MKKTANQKQLAYQKEVLRRIPKSNTLLNCFRAFWVGGLICCIGQAVRGAGTLWFALPDEGLSAWTAIVMVFLGALFTGIGVYDRIGSYAGAGSVVPITGFANSIVSPSMEFQTEGLILGTAAKMFTIAGPVLVYGIGTSVLVGLVYLAIGLV